MMTDHWRNSAIAGRTRYIGKQIVNRIRRTDELHLGGGYIRSPTICQSISELQENWTWRLRHNARLLRRARLGL